MCLYLLLQVDCMAPFAVFVRELIYALVGENKCIRKALSPSRNALSS